MDVERTLSCDSDEWEENECLDFKELEDQITQIVDNGNVEEMLNTQLAEVEMLQSMFSNPGEFIIDDHSVIADINEFVDGKSTLFPPRLDFSVNLIINTNMKLEVCVNLPHNYPVTEPDIFVRSDKLSRKQQHSLNMDLANFISTLDRGEICICPAISWLQEEALQYMTTEIKSKPIKHLNEDAKDEYFARFWIYSHHIYSKTKRKEMLDLANEYSITGFCLPGRPGIICAEGSSWDCDDWWQKVKFMNWKKIMCKKKETIKLTSSNTLDSHRKFVGFEEISFDNGKSKSRDCHMDMGELYRYLAEHDCGYVFKDYFGVDGKNSTPQHSGTSN